MIIGPNGTGKSTLVCAICIGLGFSTAHLGRAKELSEFVKHGARDATIEITLKGDAGKSDPIIRLDFARDGEKKQWQVNGQQCRAKDIAALTTGFGIQIDNLCHFLPQDRVVEFSRLSAKDRLTQTLRAAAAPETIQQHEQLKELAVERRNLGGSQTEKQNTLNQAKKRQDDQRPNVERMRERLEVLENVKQLEKLRPIAKHMEVRRAHDETKDKKNAMEATLNTLNEQVEPFDRAKKKKETYCANVKKTLDTKKKLCDLLEKELKKSKDEQDKGEAELGGLEKKRQTEETARGRRGQQVAKVRHDITRVEVEMQQQPLDVDVAEYNRRVSAKVREIREIQEQINDIREGGSERHERLKRKKDEVEQAQRAVENLSSHAGQQRNKLERMSKDTLRAWEWIEANRDKLKGEVYGPALVTCNVKERKYAAMIESLMQKMDYLRISCMNFDDYKFLGHHFASNMNLSDFALTNLKTQAGQFQSPLSKEELQNLGLEGVVMDYLEGPEPVLRMLCDSRQFDLVGIGWRDVDERQFRALEDSKLSGWVTSKSNCRVTRRAEYGPGAKSTRVGPVPAQAQMWSSQGVDVSVEMELKQRLAELKDEVESLQSTQGDTRSRLDELHASIRKLEDEKDEINREKEDKQRHNAHLAGLPHRLTGLNAKLADFQNMEAEFRQALDEIRQQRETLILRNGQRAIDYANKVDTLRHKHADVMPVAISLIEAESDVEQLKKQHLDATKERDRLVVEVENIKKEFQRLKKKARDTVDEWKVHANREPGLQDFFDNLPEEEKLRTPDELENDIDTLRARLDTLHEGDPHLLKEFEDRGRKIERLKDELATSTAKMYELCQQIVGIRNTWEPEVDSLVEKISSAFSDLFARIGCAGSVEVHKPGGGASNDTGPVSNDEQDDEQALEDGYDYGEWAIQILVRFRENEQLSLLDSHRQSGGERAVTTIYYLMALQKLSRAPFRVVDEINQGMDPRNERIVHERMVDMSCGRDEDDDEEAEGASRSQYFLITPKLLPNLKYKRGMKVHCIASGEFMPKVTNDQPAMDLGAMLQKKMSRNAQLEAEAGSLVDGVSG